MTDVRQTVADLDVEAYQEREELKENLAYACVKSLARDPGRIVVVDRTRERREMNAGKLLALSWSLAERWRSAIAKRRVGIVLPPGIGGFVTNLAIVLLGKVPVNLNFTTGQAAIEASIRKAGLDTIITHSAMQAKIPRFPWTTHTLDVQDEVQGLKKLSILGKLLSIRLRSSDALSKAMNIPREGNDKEAALLFSSGSTGLPKGVVLTHRNILGNCLQIHECHIFTEGKSLLACLPIFHSFGFTVTLWYPILSKIQAVSVASPLELRRITQAIREEKVTIMVGAPTFLRPYLLKAKPEDLRSLSITIAGAEKTPPGLGEKWEARFGSQYLEGYGLTETSPVVSSNLPDPEKGAASAASGRREGSVGRLLPGMEGRVVDPPKGKVIPRTEVGMIELKGPNVFSGYLDEAERNREVFHDGWFVTGDLGRFDEDGFLYIEGRLSRFSKIGGEMVPHGTVEEEIANVLGLGDAEVPMLAITGVGDESKGESLVLLCATDIELSDLREKLKQAGLPNLWIPRTLRRIDAIPCLASGKLDLKAIAQIAADA